MPDLSIRQLADKLGVSHTAVRDKIKALKTTSGKEIGRKQGSGKPTLLSEMDQALIASEFYVPASTENGNSSGLTVIDGGDALDVYHPRTLNLQVNDSSAQVTNAMNRLSAALERFTDNTELIDLTLVNHSASQGRQLGTKMALAKVGNAIEAKEAAEVKLLEQLGLIGDGDSSSASAS